jgi:thiol-disulfide isomerase/thioredoxin
VNARGVWIRAAVTTGVLAASYALFRVAAANAPARVSAGAPVPAFVAVTVDSAPQHRTIADFRGSPVLLNVWATWCDPCREEMPSMQRLYEAYRDRGLRVVAISIDDRGSEPLIREFVAEHQLTFDILHQGASDIMTILQVRGVPQTFLVSREGNVVATRFVADWSSPESRQLIDSVFFSAAADR